MDAFIFLWTTEQHNTNHRSIEWHLLPRNSDQPGLPPMSLTILKSNYVNFTIGGFQVKCSFVDKDNVLLHVKINVNNQLVCLLFRLRIFN